jgi:hypothetical protein
LTDDGIILTWYILRINNRRIYSGLVVGLHQRQRTT